MIWKSDSRTLMDYGQICHQGLVRQENQDSMGIAETPAGKLFVISDGVGGYAGGAEASQMISAEAVANAHMVPGDGDAMPALVELVQRLNGSVYARAQDGAPQLSRMSATLLMMLIRTVGSSEADILNVGDSRAYLYRGCRLQQLSTDHTAAQLLVDAGTISPMESRTHPQASVLTRSIGQRPEVTPSTTRVLLEPNDLLLLCSDGLHGYVEDTAIEHVLRAEGLTISGKTDALLKLALDAGGGDNITIQLIEVTSIAKSLSAAMSAPSISEGVQAHTGAGRFWSFRRLAVAILAAGLVAAACVVGYHLWQSQVPASTAPTRNIPAFVPGGPVAPPTPKNIPPPPPPQTREKNAPPSKNYPRATRGEQSLPPIDSEPVDASVSSTGIQSILPAAVHSGLGRIVTEGQRAGGKVREKLPNRGDLHPKDEPPQF